MRFVQTETVAKLAAVLSVAVISGCDPGKQGMIFGGGGTGKDGFSNSGGGDDSDDDDEEEEEIGDGVSPTITNVNARFEDYFSYGWVLLVNVAYEDPQDDIQGGKIHLTVYEAGAEEPWDSLSAIINGMDSYIEDGEVVFALEGLDTSADYDLVVQLEDDEENQSEEEMVLVSGQ